MERLSLTALRAQLYQVVDQVIKSGIPQEIERNGHQLKISLDNLGLHPVQERSHSVLVVDDDPKAVEVIATFLPSPAYSVARAFGGKEAIAQTRRLLPDLVLLDLMMPEVSGFDVVESLRSDTTTAGIPIVVVTAKQVTSKDRAASLM